MASPRVAVKKAKIVLARARTGNFAARLRVVFARNTEMSSKTNSYTRGYR
jgi:hypothetical protein